MKKFYTVFFDEIKFSNSPSLKDVLFVSLDQDSWLEIKNRKKLSSDDYDDVVNIFKPVKEKDGYTSVKHQREVGTSYFDAVSNTISNGKISTTAMDGSTESEQF